MNIYLFVSTIVLLDEIVKGNVFLGVDHTCDFVPSLWVLFCEEGHFESLLLM